MKRKLITIFYIAILFPFYLIVKAAEDGFFSLGKATEEFADKLNDLTKPNKT